VVSLDFVGKAMPFIAFKKDSTGTGSSALFKQMFHYYSYNQERFMQNYHKRSNVETTFHMIKSKSALQNCRGGAGPCPRRR
jgi:hypothetical protein